MQWLEITINSSNDRIDALTDRLIELGVDGIIIEDEAAYQAFLENNKKYWDYIDEELQNAMRGLSRVKFYFEDSPEGEAKLTQLREQLPDETLDVRTVRDEDWENNWKQYYKPVSVGERLIIVPKWEELPDTEGRAVLRLDPGLIFGTGAHPTTQMCLRALEERELSDAEVIDLGCGSGILAIASLLLGAKHAVGIDIDDKAPAVVMENAALNGLTEANLEAFAGDVTADSHVKKRLGDRKFSIVLANIVADVIIALAPYAAELMAEDGVFICSGIINGREDEVRSALEAAGLQVNEHKTQEDWNCFVLTK